MTNEITRFLVLLTAIAAISIAPAAGLSIDIPGEPINSQTVSNDTSTARAVNITDAGDPLNESDIGESIAAEYFYNATGERADLQHLNDGLWYAEFIFDTNRGTYINYSVRETTGTEDTASNMEQLSTGGLRVEMLTDVGSELTPGGEMDLRVNVTDTSENAAEESANVDAYFTNGTNTVNIQGLNNQEVSEYYNSQVNIPDSYASSYILRVNASAGSDTGSVSTVIDTSPGLDSEIVYLRSPGCQEDFFFKCERGAVVEAGLNVTGDEPDSVNISVIGFDLANFEEDLGFYERKQMTKNEEGIWTEEVTIPQIETNSSGTTTASIYMNATNGNLVTNSVEIVYIEGFKIDFSPSGTVKQGGNYDLEVGFQKPFSSQPMGADSINAEINISNDTDTLRQFDLSDLQYDNGVFTRSVNIGNWEPGTYTVNVNASDVYGTNRSAETGFFVEEVNRTFRLENDIEEEVITKKMYEFNFTVNSTVSSDINLSYVPDEDLSEFTEIENYTLIEDGGNTSVSASFNLSNQEMEEDIDGEITVMDESGFNDTLDVELELPNCERRNGSICFEGDLNESTDSSEVELAEYTVYYIANESEETDLEPFFTGNISDVASTFPEQVELNSTNNEQVFTVNYSAASPGHYSGALETGVTVPVSFSADFEPTELSISTTDSIDLGSIREDQSVEEDIEIRNNGDMQVESVSFSSDSMEIDADSSEISPGSVETFTLELSEIEESGSILVEASSGEQTVERTVEVTVEVVPDMNEKAEELRTQLNDLQTRVTTTENQNLLNTASYNISEMKSLYQEDPEEAQRMYDATSATLERIDSEVSASDTSEPSQSTDETGTDTSTGAPDSTGQTGGGSDTLVFVGIIVFVLLVVGFIFFSSYVPEEGDPLYGVLGG